MAVEIGIMSNSTEKLILPIRRSRIKKAVLKSLSRSMNTSAKIASKTDFRASHVTVALRDMRKKRCVILMNPYDKKPDIYKITDLGRKVLAQMNAPISKKKKKTYRMSGKRRSIS
jgi:predicted transcriptional regulator